MGAAWVGKCKTRNNATSYFFLRKAEFIEEKGFCQQLSAKMAKITWVRHGSGSERPQKMLLPIIFLAQGRI